MSCRLVLLGPPGSGKGTQGATLATRLGVPAISTGELFRDQISRGTDLGRQAGEFISQGHLVPDEVTNAMVEVRLDQPDAAQGFILDGYPRNTDQVAVLDQILAKRGLKIDAWVELTLPEPLIVERLLKRAQLEGRADDTEPVILERLSVYHHLTEPIIAIGRARGDLLEIDGMGSVEDVGTRIMAGLRDRLAGS